jgi:hypothetical protein
MNILRSDLCERLTEEVNFVPLVISVEHNRVLRGLPAIRQLCAVDCCRCSASQSFVINRSHRIYIYSTTLHGLSTVLSRILDLPDSRSTGAPRKVFR